MSLTSRISHLIFLEISHPEQTCTPKPRPERHARRPRPQQAISESGYRQHVAGYLSNPNESGYRQRVAGYLSNPCESGYRQLESWLPLQSPEKWISSTRLLVTSPIAQKVDIINPFAGYLSNPISLTSRISLPIFLEISTSAHTSHELSEPSR